MQVRDPSRRRAAIAPEEVLGASGERGALDRAGAGASPRPADVQVVLAGERPELS
jgi:hypothetical protein